ncbi:MAG TPA: TIGR03088 family PEP-CTERM/XrtA system glycosyltransferase [Rubrivivax sp.]|nr:TIGR03088 family PEP-CTERM/XrtA system glycosyltransferase [Rubrivivax sp.]
MISDAQDSRPLVLHVVYRFDVGGLENGVVNLINRMTDWRHAVVALTECAPAFCARVQRADVSFHSLHQQPGHGYRSWPALLRILRELRPQVVHTRNLAALEMQPAAWWAGVPLRVHGEHGRDAEDPDGRSRKHQWIRRAYRPFVHRYVALSRELERYLVDTVGFDRRAVVQITNGVDTGRFAPTPQPQSQRPTGCPFPDPDLCLAGTVGRMQTVKAQPLLAQAFVVALAQQPALRETLRLVMVGDGPLKAECEQILTDAGVRELAWLPGERSDVPAVMQGLDLFVLPSLAEGISNTILEAMASGLPVVATAVGGNADLVEDGVTGRIVPPGDVPALAQALIGFAQDESSRRAAGTAGRARVAARFSLETMVRAYQQVYEGASVALSAE